jgi:hypothetical protein
LAAASLGPIFESLKDLIHFGFEGGFDGVGAALTSGDSAYKGAVNPKFLGDTLLNPTHKTINTLLLFPDHGEKPIPVCGSFFFD